MLSKRSSRRYASLAWRQRQKSFQKTHNKASRMIFKLIDVQFSIFYRFQTTTSTRAMLKSFGWERWSELHLTAFFSFSKNVPVVPLNKRPWHLSVSLALPHSPSVELLTCSQQLFCVIEHNKWPNRIETKSLFTTYQNHFSLFNYNCPLNMLVTFRYCVSASLFFVSDSWWQNKKECLSVTSNRKWIIV